MATTLASLIDYARYDLTDYETGVIYSDDELLAYLNRMFEIMDSTLAGLESDLVLGVDETFKTTASQNYVDLATLNSNLWSDITEVWIGTDQLEKKGLSLILYLRKLRTGDELPDEWAVWNRQIHFPRGADAERDLVIHYHKKTGVLLSSANMPFSDIFNEFFREQLVLHAKTKRLGQIGKGDTMWNGAFQRVAMAEVIRRGFVPKTYKIDF